MLFKYQALFVLPVLGLLLSGCSDEGPGPLPDSGKLDQGADSSKVSDGSSDARPDTAHNDLDAVVIDGPGLDSEAGANNDAAGDGILSQEAGSDAAADGNTTTDSGPAQDQATQDAAALDSAQKDQAAKDAGAPDGAVTKLDSSKPTCTPFAGVVGKKCTKPADCGSGYTCLALSTTTGICTLACTPDNAKTPLVNEDTCAALPGQQNKVCGKVPVTGGGTKDYCLHRCNPFIGCNECAAGVACEPASGDAVGLPNLAVCLYEGCTKNSDCPVTTGVACDTVAKNCPTGSLCEALVSGSTDGMCAKPGACDVTSGLCSKHTLGKATAQVGDPCKSDLDCAGNMTCYLEHHEFKYLKAAGVACSGDSQCCSGSCKSNKCATGRPCIVRHRNGYCGVRGCKFDQSLTIAACPSGSHCNKGYAAGICQRACDLSKTVDCRNNTGDYFGDYDCRSWDQVTIGGVKMSQGAVCDFGYGLPCSRLTSPATCAVVGLPTNSTTMSCRTLQNQTLASNSPEGFCLDNTASGQLAPTWDAGSSTPDAGAAADSGTAPDVGASDVGVTPDSTVYLDGFVPGAFGSKCATSGQCTSPMTCLHATSSGGFCTKSCSTLGQACSGAPAGTGAFCLWVSGPSAYHCLFLCKSGSTTWPCPGSLKCSTTPSSPGSTQYLCVP